MVIHQRHAQGGIGIQHLFGGNDFNLVGIRIELQIAERDFLNRLEYAVQRLERPLRFGKQRRGQTGSCLLNSSWKTGKMSEGLAMRLVAKFFQCSATVRYARQSSAPASSLEKP